MTDTTVSYADWTREDLIKHIAQLESRLIEKTSTKAPVQEKAFDFSAYPKRKIALKFCYSGWEYNGLAYQSLPTALPTVEGVLFDALVKAKLVDPEAGFDGCGWEKCGRTDRGVSAAGQVVSLSVRSALGERDADSQVDRPSSSSHSIPPPKHPETDDDDRSGYLGLSPTSSPSTKSRSKLPEKYTLEHDYVSILNRLLPPTIRILAWSPVSPSFSARFSCQYRHYKYFFSPQGLDIGLMQAAASRLVGEHDFRNLCKLDPSKQITVFKRKILSVSIDPLDPSHHPNLFVFNLIGTAFLYHQVRHIMAILFLVGTGLEHPSVITNLLNVHEGAEEKVHEVDPPLQVVGGRPEYQMVDALPLMLWDCGYKSEDVDWRTDGRHTEEDQRRRRQENGTGELYHSVESIYLRSTVQDALNQHFLSAVARYHWPPTGLFPFSRPPSSAETLKQPMYIPLGGGSFKRATKYTPLLSRVRMDPPEVVNERWRSGKGSRREERKKMEAAVDDDG